MKLYLYELYKVFCKRTVWLCVLGLFAANGALFVVQKTSEDRDFLARRESLAAFEARYMDADYNDTLSELSVLQEELGALSARQIYEELSDENAFFAELLDEWNAEYPDLLQKYADSPYLTDRDARNGALFAITNVVTQLEHITGYPGFVTGMAERAEQMSHVSIFQKKGSFSYNNILKTPQDFAPLSDLPLRLGYENGVVSATNFRLTDLFMPAMLFLFCIYLFLHERDTGLDRLVKTARNGRYPTIIMKLCVLFTLSAVLSVLFYGTVVLLGARLYGYGDLGRYIQSLPAFRDCTLAITVGQYLVLYVASKAGAAILTAALMALCFVVFGRGKSIFVTLAVFTSVSYLCYAFIHSASWANLAKYVNIFSAYDTYNYYRLYININFFSLPLNRVTLCTAAGLLVFSGCSVASALCYTRHVRVDFVDRILTALSNILLRRFKRRPLRGSTSLLIHESRKLYVTGRAWVIVLAALLIAYNTWDVSPLRMATVEEAAYKLYANYWSGELTAEKIAEIEAESAYINGIPARLNELSAQYRQGKITQSDYQKEYTSVYSYAENRTKGFNTFYRQYTEAMAQPKSVTPAIVDTLSSDYYFDNELRDLLRGLLYIILLVLALARVFPLDTERGLTPILRCTRDGRAALISCKLAASIGCTVLLWVILYTPTFITLLMKYRLSFTSDVQNVEQYRGITAGLTLGGFISLMSLLQLTAAVTAAVWTLNLTRWVRKLAFGVILVAVVLAFPFLMLLLGLDFIRPFSLVAAFTPYQTAAELPGILVWYACGLCGCCGVGVALLYRERR
ncbi:MAG: hypothetical protein ACOXZM_10255 [Eubacteriales bacterium]|jgi:hypothetical protein